MKIQSVHIRNYRKLKNCHIDFDKEKTIFVGAKEIHSKRVHRN